MKYFLALLLCLSSNLLKANVLDENRNVFYATFGKERLHHDAIDASNTGTIGGFSYEYQFSQRSSVKLSYLKGNSNDSCYFFCLPSSDNDERHRFNDKQIKYQFTFPMSNRHALYVNGGVDIYASTYYSGDGSFSITDKGTGFNLGVGWQFRAHNGFGVGFEFSNLHFDDLTIESSMLHLSFTF